MIKARNVFNLMVVLVLLSYSVIVKGDVRKLYRDARKTYEEAEMAQINQRHQEAMLIFEDARDQFKVILKNHPNFETLKRYVSRCEDKIRYCQNKVDREKKAEEAKKAKSKVATSGDSVQLKLLKDELIKVMIENRNLNQALQARPKKGETVEPEIITKLVQEKKDLVLKNKVMAEKIAKLEKNVQKNGNVVLNEKIVDYRVKFDALQQELKALKTKNSMTKSSLKRIVASKKEIEKSYLELKQKLEEKNSEFNLVKKHIKDNGSNFALLTDNEKLTEENVKLKNDLNLLSGQFNKLKNKNVPASPAETDKIAEINKKLQKQLVKSNERIKLFSLELQGKKKALENATSEVARLRAFVQKNSMGNVNVKKLNEELAAAKKATAEAKIQLTNFADQKVQSAKLASQLAAANKELELLKAKLAKLSKGSEESTELVANLSKVKKGLKDAKEKLKKASVELARERAKNSKTLQDLSEAQKKVN